MAAVVSRPRVRVRVRTVDGSEVPVARIAAAGLHSGQRLDLSYDVASRLFTHGDLTSGTYDLTVWKVGYEAPGQTVDVDADASVQVAVVIVPPENPDAAWLM